MKTAKTLMIFVLVGFLFGACKSAEKATDMAPAKSMEQQLIDQSIAAQGGLEAMQSVETLRTTGEVYMPIAGMTMPVTIIKKRPDLMRIEVNIESMGVEVVNGYDGETAWAVNPMQGGTQKITGEQARTFKEQADMDGILVDYTSKGYSVEYVGDEDVNGSPAKKLKVTRPDSTSMFIFLDAASHLQVKVEAQGTNPMTGTQAKMETYLSDYRDVDGIQQPFAMETHLDGDLFQKVTVKQVESNVEVDDAIFAFPGK